MARGFVTGVLWGCIVVGTGLVVLSQMAPVQQAANSAAPMVPKAGDPAAAKPAETAKPAEAVAAKDAAPVVVAIPPPKVADAGVAKPAAAVPAETAKPVVAAPVVAGPAVTAPAVTVPVAPEVAAAPPVAAAPEPAAPDMAVKPEGGAVVVSDLPVVAPATAEAGLAATPAAPEAPVAPAVESAPVPAAPASLPPERPAQDVGTGMAAAPMPAPLPDRPAAPEAPPSLAGLEPALTAPGAEAAPVAPLPPEPEGAKDALLAPALQPGQAEPAHLPQIAPAEDPAVAVIAPAVVPAPKADVPPKESASSTIEAQVPTLPPVKGLVDRVPKGMNAPVAGVEVNNLPHIGDAPKVEAAVKDVRPVTTFARKFEAAAGKPLFAILLHDVGTAGMARSELAKLPFPVSFVIDPLATDAKDASATYRAAGQEVVTLANGIPAGAEASDLAETFQTLAGILPESVAVIDQDLGGFQDDRPMAGMVLPILQDEGRGLVTYDRGLNAADQIARRDGVPAAVIFRRLDGEGENKATIRRYLDRAAFKAAQEGQVVVIGDTRADTVAAILEWTVEGRASSVTLAPLTAVLGK